MSADSDSVRLKLLVPRLARQLPADLLAVVGALAVVSLVVLTPGLWATPLRFVAAPFALFAPGYVIVAALFPGADDAAEQTGQAAEETRQVDEETRQAGERPRNGEIAIGWVERLSFSVAASVAIVALLALALDFGPWAIQTVAVLLALDAFVLVGVGAAACRR